MNKETPASSTTTTPASSTTTTTTTTSSTKKKAVCKVCRSGERDGFLHTAARYGHADCLKLLLERGNAPIDAKDGSAQETALNCAVESGFPDIVKILIDAGANLEVQAYCKRTALGMAVSKKDGDVFIVKMLLDAGASVDTQDYFGLSPLMQCCDYALKEDFFQLILSSNPNPHLTNSQGKTALDLLRQAWRPTDTLQTKDRMEETFLTYVAHHDQPSNYILK